MSAPFRLPSAADYLDFVRTSASPIVQLLSGLDDARQKAAWVDMTDKLGRFNTANGWTGPNELLLTAGQRPRDHVVPALRKIGPPSDRNLAPAIPVDDVVGPEHHIEPTVIERCIVTRMPQQAPHMQPLIVAHLLLRPMLALQDHVVELTSGWSPRAIFGHRAAHSFTYSSSLPDSGTAN